MTRSHHTRSLAALVATLLVSGCSLGLEFDRSKIDKGGKDAGGVDSGALDAGGDGAVKDAGADATTPDAGSDAGPTPLDAGQDATIDAGEDAGVECSAPSQCAGTDTACRVRTCVSGACGFMNIAAGTDALSGQTSGDCQRVKCDGNGGTTSVNDDADLPNDGKECTTDTCNGGTPTYTPLAAQDDCPVTGGTNVCNGAGDCVQCVNPSDCGTDTECVSYACNSNTCVATNTPVNTPLTAGQTAGNCKQLRCNGTGGIVDANDDGDIPNDGKECTNDVCTAGVPSNPALGAQVDCPVTGGTKVCDGAGDCVQCVVAGNCGTDTACRTFACNSNTCMTNDVADGTPLASGSQTPGDCQQLQCNGAGGQKSVNDDNDLPIDNLDCTTDLCGAGVPSHGSEPTTTSCNDGGGSVCDGNGSCVACNVDVDCTPEICIDNACIAQGVLTSVTGTPAELVAGASGDFVVAFTTAHPVASNGVVSVVFPAGYDVQSATLSAATGFAGSATLMKVGQELILTRTSGSTAAAGAKSLTFAAVRNPQVSGLAGNINVATKTGANVVIDSGTSGNAVTIAPGVFTATGVVLADTTQSATTGATLNATTANPLPADGVIRVVFPAGFDVTAASLSGVTGADGTFALAVDAPTRSVTLTRNADGTSTAGGTALSIMLNGIVNPATTGATGTYEIVTRTSGAVLIDATSSVVGPDITP